MRTLADVNPHARLLAVACVSMTFVDTHLESQQGHLATKDSFIPGKCRLMDTEYEASMIHDEATCLASSRWHHLNMIGSVVEY